MRPRHIMVTSTMPNSLGEGCISLVLKPDILDNDWAFTNGNWCLTAQHVDQLLRNYHITRNHSWQCSADSPFYTHQILKKYPPSHPHSYLNYSWLTPIMCQLSWLISPWNPSFHWFSMYLNVKNIHEKYPNINVHMGVSENSVPLNPMVLLIIIPIKWLFHWEYTLFSDKPIWARVKRRYERLQLRSVITTQNMWFTVCSDRGPYVAIPLFRLCLWLKLPVGRMTFRSFDVRVRHWSSRSGLVFLGSCKMACRQVYMR